MAENVPTDNVGNENSAEKESAGTPEVWRPKFQWGSKPCLNVAVVPPSTRRGSSGTPPSDSLRQDRHQSPVLTFPMFASRIPVVSWSRYSQSRGSIVYNSINPRRHRPRRNFTRVCPFSFDLRDSMQRVAREQRLERLKMIEEREQAMAATFRANPVRKYKPLVLKVRTHHPAHPRSPVSRNDQ